MPSINHGTSVYHHVAGMYLRDESGSLLVSEGRHAEHIRSCWSDIRKRIFSDAEPSESTELPSGKVIKTIQTTLPFQSGLLEEPHTFRIRELQEPSCTPVRGILLSKPSHNSLQPAFWDWAKTFLLLQTRLLTTSGSHPSDSPDPECLKTAEQIADLFEETLKNTSQDDAWLTGGGRQHFINKTYPFIKDNRKIQFCLPAFPCKSSNPEKVAGRFPDAAEYHALQHLHAFVEQVCAIYSRGATLWIISDGHVFSDCIGVDDATVDEYGHTLATQYSLRSQSRNNLIQFTGLEDLFFSDPEATSTFSPQMLDTVSIPQPIETTRTESAQKCRLLLEKIGGIDRSHLRGLIAQKDPGTIKLYQGQSRFMLEDLAGHLAALGAGMKQKKRIASSVAAEMIARNHAYSNLVELLFPHHIRLSIHAHSNSGPKFGIRLFPKGTVHPAQDRKSLISMSENSRPDYEFQIPTPWHNCLAKVEGSDTLLLTRTGIARDAVNMGLFEGEWRDGADRGYFALRRVREASYRTPGPQPVSNSRSRSREMHIRQ
ncbi:isocyanide synthase family protein [Aspergillus lucknowensis]|uniref:Pyoverdine/dityrosine biosynthesis protein-domain-containing protein n=1 Tax=Aspergillus lucknowensis TaxID=176173 RepID=A0ABR4LIQ7_9EURO